MTKFTRFSLFILIGVSTTFHLHAYAQSPKSAKSLETIQDLASTVHVAIYKQDIHFNFYEGLSNVENHLHSALFSGLVTLDPNTLSIQNNLAASWFINDTHTEYIFHIRRDAVFSDGSPVNAEDVKESWLTILRKKSGFAYLLEPIVGVLEYQTGNGTLEDIGLDVISERTLRVRLVRPNSEFIKIIAHSVFSITKAKFTNIDDWESMLGLIPFSGPYIISTATEDYVILEKNALFWAKEFVRSDHVVVHFYEENDEEQLAQDIQFEKIHWSMFSVDNEELSPWEEINTIFGTNYLFFRSAKEPWNNKDVRTAIRLLVPFDDIREEEYFFPASTLIPELNDDYSPPKIEDKQDVEKALALLEQAGYPNGDALPPLLVLAPAHEESYAEVFDVIKQYVEEETNIKVDIQTLLGVEYYDALSKKDFVMGYYAWIGDYVSPAAFLQMWVSPNKSLGHGYDNEEYRKSYIEAISLDDDDEEKNIALQNTERILLEDTVVIPLSYLYAVNVVRNDIIDGWKTNILDQHHFSTLYQKEKQLVPFITKQSKGESTIFSTSLFQQQDKISLE